MSQGMVILPNGEEYEKKVGDIITLSTNICFGDDPYKTKIETQVLILDIVKTQLSNLEGYTQWSIAFEYVE